MTNDGFAQINLHTINKMLKHKVSSRSNLHFTLFGRLLHFLLFLLSSFFLQNSLFLYLSVSLSSPLLAYIGISSHPFQHLNDFLCLNTFVLSIPLLSLSLSMPLSIFSTPFSLHSPSPPNPPNPEIQPLLWRCHFSLDILVT